MRSSCSQSPGVLGSKFSIATWSYVERVGPWGWQIQDWFVSLSLTCRQQGTSQQQRGADCSYWGSWNQYTFSIWSSYWYSSSCCCWSCSSSSTLITQQEEACSFRWWIYSLLLTAFPFFLFDYSEWAEEQTKTKTNENQNQTNTKHRLLSVDDLAYGGSTLSFGRINFSVPWALIQVKKRASADGAPLELR